CLKEGRFGRGKDNKVRGGSRGRGGVSRVARRILKPYNARRERVQKPKNQRHMPGEARHRRKMIKIDWDRFSFCRLYQRVDVGDQTVVRYALVVKWRQHQHASEADLGGMAGQRHPRRYRGGGRSHPQTGQRQTLGPFPLPHTLSPLDLERGRFTSSAEDVEAVAAIVKQEACQINGALEIGRAILVDWRGDGGDHAG